MKGDQKARMSSNEAIGILNDLVRQQVPLVWSNLHPSAMRGIIELAAAANLLVPAQYCLNGGSASFGKVSEQYAAAIFGDDGLNRRSWW